MKEKIPEMNSVAKNASPSFVEIKKVNIFLGPFKKWKSKIGLSHALGTHLESLYDEKKFPEMNSVAKIASPTFLEI